MVELCSEIARLWFDDNPLAVIGEREMEQVEVSLAKFAVFAVDAEDDETLPVDADTARVDRKLFDIPRADGQFVALRVE